MIVWQGVIGKMVGFLATKLMGKKIDLLLDDRKKAAKAFVKLYNAITELEQITSLLIKELNDIKNGNNKFISRRSLSFISKAIDVQSWAFLDSVRDLGSVVEMYDPVLAAELVQLSDYKASFLMQASRSFRHNNNLSDADQEFFTYDEPAEKFLEIDFERTCKWLEARQERLYDVSDVFEWPESFIVRYCIEEGDTETRVVRLDDTHSALDFLDMLEKHSHVLASGKEHLRQFIITNYKPEEILYQ